MNAPTISSGDMPSGQIPGSIRFPWTRLLDDNGHMRSAADLLSADEVPGLDSELAKRAVCATSGSTPLALAGSTDAGSRICETYDRGWAEWSITPDLPARTAVMNRATRLRPTLLLALCHSPGRGAATASETDGLMLQPVDVEMSTAYVMRHRPFVLPDHLTPAFDFDAVSTDADFTDDEARVALQRFLELRNLPDRVSGRSLPGSTIRATCPGYSGGQSARRAADALRLGPLSGDHRCHPRWRQRIGSPL